MDVNLQKAIINYRQLRVMSFLKGKTKVKKKWLKKLRKKIVSYIDTEIEFTELYNILKKVENEVLGFRILPKRFEATTSNDERVFFQQVEVMIWYPFNLAEGIYDVGFAPNLEIEDLTVHKSNIIKPNEIINVSNKKILETIKALDNHIYKLIVQGICNYWYEKIKSTEEDYLFKLVSKAIEEYEVCEGDYIIGDFHDDCICVQKNDDKWIVYIGKDGEKHDIKTYQFCIEACCDLLERLSESDKMCYEIKKLFIKKLKNCDSASVVDRIMLYS